MARERKQLPLRIAPELHAALQRWADDELRSVNAQIEAVLMDAVRRAGRLRPPAHGPGDDGDPSG